MMETIVILVIMAIIFGAVFFVEWLPKLVRQDKFFDEAPKRILSNELEDFKIQFQVFGRWFDCKERKVYHHEWTIWSVANFTSEQEAEEYIKKRGEEYKQSLKNDIAAKIHSVKRNSWRKV